MMIGRDDDRSLIAAARGGDTEAFGVLVRRYQDRLYPTALRLTGRAEDAHDLLQEAFLRAYLKLGHFHGESAFFTWLYRITVNLALSQRRTRHWSAPGGERSGSPPADWPADPAATDPSRHLEQAERDAQVQQALDQLSPEHRAVVVMKDIDGLRYEEIAESLRIPVGTVRSRLHRARLELKDRLRGLLHESPLGEGRNP
jgi:RNA polymerase sigma-70 factor (ECF subfamily)